jgi:hypothetical protein
VGNAVFVAFSFAFLFLGGFPFAKSLGMVALAVAAGDVLDALLLFIDAVDMPTMALFGGRILIVADFVFVLVFSFVWVLIDAIGSSSDVESVDPHILIKQSMFLPHDDVHMGEGIFCGLVNIYNGGGSWWSTSTLL